MDYKAFVKKIVPEKLHHLLGTMYFMYLPLRAAFYSGSNVICPCCNSHFRKFLPAQPGFHTLQNERCPKCDSWKRHRVIWLYLKNKTNLFSDKLKVLHVAPEYPLQKQLKKLPNLNYVSADLSSFLAEVKMDITNIPYETNCFDVILCSHVLEHIPDEQKAMKELLRVLKPGGWAILQVPIDCKREETFEDPTIVSPKDRERLYWQWDHVRLYGRDYKDRLKKAGFKVKVDSYVKELENDTIQKYGLAKKEDIYFCSK